MGVLTVTLICFGVVILLLFGGWLIYVRVFSEKPDIFDDMDGNDFEKYCADLLIAMGYEEVELTPASHDFGVDILADKDGISFAFQCKCYTEPVGIKAVQEIYAGRDYYDSMVGVVITNQSFTKTAEDFAKKLNILLWDGELISEMISKYMI